MLKCEVAHLIFSMDIYPEAAERLASAARRETKQGASQEIS